MTPLVSICVPAYRAERFIEATIRSALAQTFGDFELIVVDDASPDRTVELAAAFSDPRMRIVTNRETAGAAANWNRAVSLCRGRYVKLLCSDDTIYRSCLEQQVAALETDPDVALVSAQRDIIDEQGAVIFGGRGIGRLRGKVGGRAAMRALVRSGTNIIGEPSATLMRRSSLEAAGSFDPSEAYMIDAEMWSRLLALGDFFGIDEPLATFRISTTSWSANLAKEQAGQARAFFHRLRERGMVTPTDVVIGSIRATLLAQARRAVFRRLAKRGAARPVTTER